jgi:septal ring factor EnvC (AmiA/AmiB activator)
MRRAFQLRAIAVVALIAMASGAAAQREAIYDDPKETRAALSRALADRSDARKRAEKLDSDAARATEAADRTAAQAAALAARVQQSEANIAAAQARLSLIERQRAVLRLRLAEKQKPLVELTASLQKFSRRPIGLSLLRPGSVREVVYMRAMLSSAIPQVEKRTAALRAEIVRGRALERDARGVLAQFRAGERDLVNRRKTLATLEARQRVASRQASGTAARETEKAIALGEQARDLDALVVKLDQASALRQELAALPGPILRPARPADAQLTSVTPAASLIPAVRPPAGYQVPVAGRIVAGFGAALPSGTRNEGVTFAPRSGAQIVAPAPGRVAFAGVYRGYGQIVIIEHGQGWISLVTGLAHANVTVGDKLVGGSPLGTAGVGRPTISLELRRQGEPINPLEFLG